MTTPFQEENAKKIVSSSIPQFSNIETAPEMAHVRSGIGVKPNLLFCTKISNRIHIRFDGKTATSNQTSSEKSEVLVSTMLKTESTNTSEEVRTTEVNVVDADDDDVVEITGTEAGPLLSHVRSDCPRYRYVFIESVTKPVENDNVERCSKCFCYLCDKPALQCGKWTTTPIPHCNANASSSCWKARRNVKGSPIVSELTSEELSSDIIEADKLALEYVIRIKEAYVTYRNGIPCEFHLVPCQCACHSTENTGKNSCGKCKAVHDVKKQFNYDPVRKEIQDIANTIAQEYGDKPTCALILFETILSEICSHRPADFNRVTKKPSNPDAKCRWDTPRIITQCIEKELVKIFTLNEVELSIKNKFLKLVKASVQRFQIEDFMKKFMQMRHWDDQLLQAVLMGYNMSGRNKQGDCLREAPLIIEMRVKKLDKEHKYKEISRYLKALLIRQTSSVLISDGSRIATAMQRWNLTYLAKQGYFRDVCTRLTDDIAVMKSFTVDFFIDLSSILSGKDLPPNTKLVGSFNESKNVEYELVGADKTVLLFLCLLFMEINSNAHNSTACHLWLANWLSEEKHSHNSELAPVWLQTSKKLLETRKQASKLKKCSHFLQECKPISSQAALYACSLVIYQLLTKLANIETFIPEVIKAFDNNPWAIYDLFSQPSLLCLDSDLVVAWLTNYMKESGNVMDMFDFQAFTSLITNRNFADVSALLKQWVGPVWPSNCTSDKIRYVLKVTAAFASRLIIEPYPGGRSEEWLNDIVFAEIIDKNLHEWPPIRHLLRARGCVFDKTLNNMPECGHEDELACFPVHFIQIFNHRAKSLDTTTCRVAVEDLLPLCDVIGKACCYISTNNIPCYRKLFTIPVPHLFIEEIFSIHLKKCQRNLLEPDEVATLFYSSVREDYPVVLNAMLSHFTDNHECAEKGSFTVKIMEEVIKILYTSQSQFAMMKPLVCKLYKYLCSHEALCWLICTKCSARMPNDWTRVWIAMETNGMSDQLRALVQHTMEQFTSWISHISVEDVDDIKRLLHCFDTFVVTVAEVLIQCKFDQDKIKKMMSSHQYSIADAQLRSEYFAIVESVFKRMRVRRHQITREAIVAALNIKKINNGLLPPREYPMKRLGSGRADTSSGGSSAVEPMFQGSKYQSKKPSTTKCPNCDQVMRDFKSCTCRFCDTTLAGVLASEKNRLSPVIRKRLNNVKGANLKYSGSPIISSYGLAVTKESQQVESSLSSDDDLPLNSSVAKKRKLAVQSGHFKKKLRTKIEDSKTSVSQRIGKTVLKRQAHCLDIPMRIKLPQNTDLSRICLVALNEFPSFVMDKIRSHQPGLELHSLFT